MLGFLARDNNSGCTGPIIYLLRCVKENIPCEFNLGVILARSLHTVVSRNFTDKTPIYVGAIATLVFNYIEDERGCDDNMGTRVRESNLLDFVLTSLMDISTTYGDQYWYNYLSSNGERVSIRLPRTDLFDRNTRKWRVDEAPPQEEPRALEMQNYQPQEAPQYPGMQGYPYGYYPGGGTGGYGHYPGY